MSIHEKPMGIIPPLPQVVPGQIVIKEVSPGQVKMESNIPDKVQVMTILLDIVKSLAAQIKQEPERIVKPQIQVVN